MFNSHRITTLNKTVDHVNLATCSIKGAIGQNLPCSLNLSYNGLPYDMMVGSLYIKNHWINLV